MLNMSSSFLGFANFVMAGTPLMAVVAFVMINTF